MPKTWMYFLAGMVVGYVAHNALSRVPGASKLPQV